MSPAKRRPFLDLPADVRGVAAGSAYKPFLWSGRSNTYGTSESIPGLKTGRGHELLSQHEVAVFYLLHFWGHVLDIREQYPAFSAALLDRINTDKDFVPARTDVPTLDFVLTIADRDGQPYRTAVLNVKESVELKKPEVLWRFIRERKFCQELGWSWHLVTEKQINAISVGNARRLYEWINPSDLAATKATAYAVANWFKKFHSSKYDLLSLLHRCAKQLNLEASAMTHLFAAACYYELIRCDMTTRIELTRPLRLAEPDSAMSPFAQNLLNRIQDENRS